MVTLSTVADTVLVKSTSVTDSVPVAETVALGSPASSVNEADSESPASTVITGASFVPVMVTVTSWFADVALPWPELSVTETS